MFKLIHKIAFILVFMICVILSITTPLEAYYLEKERCPYIESSYSLGSVTIDGNYIFYISIEGGNLTDVELEIRGPDAILIPQYTIVMESSQYLELSFQRPAQGDYTFTLKKSLYNCSASTVVVLGVSPGPGENPWEG